MRFLFIVNESFHCARLLPKQIVPSPSIKFFCAHSTLNQPVDSFPSTTISVFALCVTLQELHNCDHAVSTFQTWKYNDCVIVNAWDLTCSLLLRGGTPSQRTPAFRRSQSVAWREDSFPESLIRAVCQEERLPLQVGFRRHQSAAYIIRTLEIANRPAWTDHATNTNTSKTVRFQNV